MILLNHGSQTPRGRLAPESFELTLTERDSRAVIGLGPEEPALAPGDWVQDDTEPGAGIVWRVQSVGATVTQDARSATLEHVIRTLADRILPEKVTSQTMGGTAAGCTARQAVTWILGRQSDWTLGEFDYDSVTNPYHFSGETLLAALETVTASLEDPIWTSDTTVYPFRLNITRKSQDADCELRAGRNLQSLQQTMDRSRMYTRLYPVGKNNLKLPEGYVSMNESVWGVVEKTETDQGCRTADELRAWAMDRLRRHAQPVMTVTISGLDFSEATGEPLDRLRIGKVCRVPLPEHGMTVQEAITRLVWRNKVQDPESVQVTLANAPEDVQTILAEQRSGGGKKARSDAEVNEENGLVVGEVESGLYTRIAQTASELRREAHDEAESMRTFVIQTASETLSIAENDVESLRTEVRQTASSWETRLEEVTGSDGRVTAASIAIAINESTGESEAKINAARVYIGNSRSTTVIAGKAELTDLQATDAKIESVTVIEGSARYVQSGKIYATSSLSVGNGSGGGSGTFYFRGDSYQRTSVVVKNDQGGTVAEGYCLGTGGSTQPINLSHYHKITIAEGTGALAGKMVVTLGAAQSTEGSANFNIADTQVYKDGVSAVMDQWAAATWPAAGSSASVTIDRPGDYQDLVLSLVQGTGSDRKMVYMRNQDGGTIAQYETAVDVWDSTIYNVNEQPTGIWRTVAINTAYTYHYLTVSANGVSRKIRINVY